MKQVKHRIKPWLKTRNRLILAKGCAILGVVPALSLSAQQPHPPVIPIVVDQGPKNDQKAPPDTEYMGMKLHPDWMPKRETKTQEYTRDFIRICHAALGNNEKDHDVLPKTIVGPLTWLMPIDDAAKKLTGMRAQMGGAAVVTTPNWPQRSLFVRSYFGDITVPPTMDQFKEVRLISDLKGQLVSAQFTYNHPKKTTWEQVPDGLKEPYYDFVAMKNNASTSYVVKFQIKPYRNGGQDTGITCIHTLLTANRVLQPIDIGGIENVRWYLPAPLARKILEIAEPKDPLPNAAGK